MSAAAAYIHKDGSTSQLPQDFKSTKQAKNYCRNNRKPDHAGFAVADRKGNVKTYKFEQ